MRASILILGLSLSLPISTVAQNTRPIEIQSEPIKKVATCIDNAIKGNNIKKAGERVIFYCYGDQARQFFTYLSNKETLENKGRNGVYRIRYTNESPNKLDYCWQQVEDGTGEAANTFGCAIYLPIGPFINE